MHSRIFQISKKPIKEFLEEYRYQDGFIGVVADYVVKINDISSDLHWLTTCCKGIEVKQNKKNIKLKIVSKRDYFAKYFDKFQEALDRLQDYTIQDFMNWRNKIDVADLEYSYEDKFGFYIDDNDEYYGITTFNDFMRHVEDGDTYYIGSVFDYHS